MICKPIWMTWIIYLFSSGNHLYMFHLNDNREKFQHRCRGKCRFWIHHEMFLFCQLKFHFLCMLVYICYFHLLISFLLSNFLQLSKTLTHVLIHFIFFHLVVYFLFSWNVALILFFILILWCLLQFTSFAFSTTPFLLYFNHQISSHSWLRSNRVIYHIPTFLSIVSIDNTFLELYFLSIR